MEYAKIIALCVFGFASMLMLIRGIVCFFTKNPVIFYPGENMPKKDSIKNVKKYNCYHGLLWVICAICLFLPAALIVFSNTNEDIYTILFAIFIVIVAALMSIFHEIFLKKFTKKKHL